MANQYLYTVPFKELLLWDVKRYKKLEFTSHYPIDYLGNHINSETEKIDLSNYPEQDFDILGITNDRGMIDAYTAKGKTFNQPYKIVKDGFIAYNPYRVNVGSIGIKTNKTKGNLISPAYVVFSCKSTLLPEFLFVLMKTQQFHNQIKENTSGSVRQNLTFDALSRIRIPLPNKEEQQRILDKYEREIKYAEAITQAQLSAISDYFVKELLPHNYEVSSIKKLFGTIFLKEIDRWDVWSQLTNVKSNKYQVVPFGRLIIGKPQYGANTPGVDKENEFRYIRITDINENGTLNNDIVFPKVVDKQYVLHEDDFLIARSGNTVGKTFLYKESFGDAIYAGYLVRYIINKKLANPEYLFFYSKTIMYQNWVKKNQRISGQPNINGQEYLAVPIILPDLEKQQEMVNMSKIIQQDVVSQVRQSEMLVGQAKQNFENAIFN